MSTKENIFVKYIEFLCKNVMKKYLDSNDMKWSVVNLGMKKIFCIKTSQFVRGNCSCIVAFKFSRSLNERFKLDKSFLLMIFELFPNENGYLIGYKYQIEKFNQILKSILMSFEFRLT